MVDFKENYNCQWFQEVLFIPMGARGIKLLISLETYRTNDLPGEGPVHFRFKFCFVVFSLIDS